MQSDLIDQLALSKMLNPNTKQGNPVMRYELREVI